MRRGGDQRVHRNPATLVTPTIRSARLKIFLTKSRQALREPRGQGRTKPRRRSMRAIGGNERNSTGAGGIGNGRHSAQSRNQVVVLGATYTALATREGLAAWWTNNTQGESKVGGVLQFRFEAGGFDMKVLELDPGKRVLWQVVDGPEEWIGTKVSFELKTGGRLHHRSLQAPGLEGAGGVHAPLQHQVGGLSDEPEVAGRNGKGRPRTRTTSRSTTGTRTRGMRLTCGN